ncbi:hypothetical protein [Aeromonas enteropelogenes]|uniref:hypothetical protein n=1 Tax=Aeromonas enteropelogenes TaxID=29489 RepID=UPI003B9FD02B
MFELNNIYGALIPALFAFAWSKPGLYIQESIKLYALLLIMTSVFGIWSLAVNMIHLGVSELDLPSESYKKVIAYVDTFNIPPALVFMPSILFPCHAFLVWFSGKLVAHEKQNATPPV